MKIQYCVLVNTLIKIIYNNIAAFWRFPVISRCTGNFMQASLAYFYDFHFGAPRNFTILPCCLIYEGCAIGSGFLGHEN
jgi:hypothetical protein